MPIKILAIGAHPDDIEMGLGGCLARHNEEGDVVSCLIFSRGENGVSDGKIKDSGLLDEKERIILKGKMREEETKKALKLLGVKEDNIKILELPDNGIKIDEAVAKDVEEYINKVNPDLVYTHHCEDDHLDHVNTSFISFHTARGVKTILLYEAPSTRASFSPNYFVDISAYLQKKIDALRMHETQAGKEYMDEEVTRAKAKFRGFQAKVHHAEGFVVKRMVVE